MLQASKNALRHELLQARMAIEQERRLILNKALCENIATSPYFSKADALLAYLPMRGEPDLTALFPIATARGIPIFLPRCEQDGMQFLLYSGKDTLTPDRFGIAAPPSNAPIAVPTARTLCLVPGLAAAKDGARLGYGGGYYDRFLPDFKGTALFAIYEQFLFDTLPHTANDFPITHVITEKGEL